MLRELALMERVERVELAGRGQARGVPLRGVPTVPASQVLARPLVIDALVHCLRVDTYARNAACVEEACRALDAIVLCESDRGQDANAHDIVHAVWSALRTCPDVRDASSACSVLWTLRDALHGPVRALLPPVLAEALVREDAADRDFVVRCVGPLALMELQPQNAPVQLAGCTQVLALRFGSHGDGAFPIARLAVLSELGAGAILCAALPRFASSAAPRAADRADEAADVVYTALRCLEAHPRLCGALAFRDAVVAAWPDGAPTDRLRGALGRLGLALVEDIFRPPQSRTWTHETRDLEALFPLVPRLAALAVLHAARHQNDERGRLPGSVWRFALPWDELNRHLRTGPYVRAHAAAVTSSVRWMYVTALWGIVVRQYRGESALVRRIWEFVARC